MYKLRALVLLVALILGTQVITTQPAQAHAQWNCAHGAGCLYQDINGGPAGASHLTLYWSAWADGQCHNLPSTWDDSASSVVSDYGSGYDLILYEFDDCRDVGDRLVSPRHLNFTGWWGFLNDDASSFKIVP
jgi:hypothetical protein